MSTVQPWWKGATIYQIYPRSFKDSNGDGVGDLKGATSKLKHVASLGVDAIWLSPFFTSPMHDFGYDVSDYRDVDPIFGTMDDFRVLLATAHELGLKVIIDQVISHTAEVHPWFSESRASRDNPKADWFVWADAKADGTPPNNWLSIFGGSAWEWDGTRQQYYLHNFLASQPDVNFHCDAARQAQLDNMRFWLDLGVDGFRLDTVNFYYHNQSLANNPAVPDGERKTFVAKNINPYAWQRHVNDLSQPENLDFLQDLRVMMDEYPDTTLIREIGDDKPLERMAEYTSGNSRLHMAYSFDLLTDEHSPDYIRDVIRRYEAGLGDGWPCWALSNHDVVRAVSRWPVDGSYTSSARAQYALVLAALSFSMRGSVCLYQGEELGLPEADVQFEDLQDPYGIRFWPAFKGRDGCRTPMVWQTSSDGGFSEGRPWLPIDEHHLPLAVSAQDADPESTLSKMRALLKWRQSQPALISGELEIVEDTGPLLCWIRSLPAAQVLVAINLTGKPLSLDLNDCLPGRKVATVSGHPFTAQLDGDMLSLPPFQAYYGEIGQSLNGSTNEEQADGQPNNVGGRN